ncbi:hypothetical protein [Mesorhizobium sp.]|uniref:hypothetical protein n=1 Tax=Mesorhizobium sp. TaxID=1871066 RepID=UPI003BAAD00A
MLLLLPGRRAWLRNGSSHQRRQTEIRRDAKQLFADSRSCVRMLQLVYEFQCSIELTHRNINPMLPSALRSMVHANLHSTTNPGLQNASYLLLRLTLTPHQGKRGYLQTR